MNTGTDTGKQQDNEKEGFTMRVRQNRKLLRRGLCIALVLLMLLNSIGVMAGSSDISVSNYDEFVRAMEQVGHLDTILIKGIVEIPCNSSVGFDDKVIVIKGAGGYINFDSGDYSSVKNIIFDGNAKELFNPFIRCYGSVSFIDCTFKDCRSSGGSGAVNVYADCDFTDCTFRNNKGAYGGNLGISSGLTKLKSCTLMGGEATVRGGGHDKINIAFISKLSEVQVT